MKVSDVNTMNEVLLSVGNSMAVFASHHRFTRSMTDLTHQKHRLTVADPPDQGSRPAERPVRLGMSVIRQFMVVALLVLAGGLTILGAWVAHSIEEAVGSSAATGAAHFMSSVVDPHLKGYATTGTISDTDRQFLAEATRIAAQQRNVFSIKIWAPDGTVVYATNRSVEGRKFQLGDAFKKALSGQVGWELDHHPDEDNAAEHATGIPFLEIYSPVRDGQGRIFAVTEFYENAELIGGELSTARKQTWLVTALVSVSTILALFLIVTKASRTIDRQRIALDARVNELSHLAMQNDELRKVAQHLSRHSAEENERFLSRIGSDLHDGPAQLVALALLKLDPKRWAAEAMRRDVTSIRSVLLEALEEVRGICSGLVMPGVRDVGPNEAVRFVINSHEARTNTTVAADIGEIDERLPDYTKLCLCRVIQEGLSNAYRHAGGIGQAVRVRDDGMNIIVAISDDGPGPVDAAAQAHEPRLGLAGLRRRLEVLGGACELRTRSEGGALLSAKLPYRPEEEETEAWASAAKSASR